MATVLDITTSIVRFKKAFIDANFLWNWYNRNSKWHKTCKELIVSLGKKGTKLVTSTRVIDEFIWIALKANNEEFMGPDWYDRYKAGQLKVEEMSKILLHVDRWIKQLKVEIVEVCPTCIPELVNEMITNNLLPADAIYIKTMHKKGINVLISMDKDYRTYPGITLISNIECRPPVVSQNRNRAS